MHYFKKIKSTTLTCLLLAACSCHVTASQQSRGRVNMQGSIIDTACSITMDDRYQTVQITTQPVAMVIQPTEKVSVSFHINLESCSLQSGATFRSLSMVHLMTESYLMLQVKPKVLRLKLAIITGI